MPFLCYLYLYLCPWHVHSEQVSALLTWFEEISMKLEEMYDEMVKLDGDIFYLADRLESNPLDGSAMNQLIYKQGLKGALLNDIQEAELLEIE